MFNFKEKFKTFETIELLRMLERPDKYQPDAIDAAKEILDERKNAHPEEWQNAVEKLETENSLNVLNKTDVSDIPPVDEDVHDIWIEDETNVKQQQLATYQLWVISAVMAMIAMYDLYFTISWLFRSNTIIEQGLRNPVGLASLLLLVLSVVFLFKKDKIGWVLLVAQCMFNLLASLAVIGFFFFNSYNTNNFSFPYSFYNFILPLIVYATILFRVLNQRMMKLFNVNFKLFWMTSAAVVFLCICYIVGLSMARH